MNTTSMLPVGFVLHNTYRIECHLASGGFGNTYKAVNQTNGKYVAIKEFFMKGVTERDETTSSVNVSNIDNYDKFSQQKAKFRKESQRLRKFDNSHIVSVHDSFEENGTAYYVMEFIDGESLSARMKRTGLALTEQEVRNILPQILDALKTVHNEGLWHLDLKPGNIMIDRMGKITLIDFGASKQFDAATGGATAKTKQSFTDGYAPHEQMEENYSKYGPWTDIYALGATLYALLTKNRPPKLSDLAEDNTSDKHEVLQFPEGVSSKMRSLILWMMSFSRKKRPQSVDAIQNFCSYNSRISGSTGGQDETIQESAGEEEATMFASAGSAANNEETRYNSRTVDSGNSNAYTPPSYETVHRYDNGDSSGSNNTALYVILALIAGVLLSFVLFNLHGCYGTSKSYDDGVESLAVDTALYDDLVADSAAVDTTSVDDTTYPDDYEAVDTVSYDDDDDDGPSYFRYGYIKPEGGYTNIRNAPGGDVIYQIEDGAEIQYAVYNSSWYIVYDMSGKRLGYVHSSKIVGY